MSPSNRFDPQQSIPASTPNTVSWPSVFWALVPIALNSMTQPAGSLTHTLTPPQSFYFRVSPLICLIDAISVVSSFVYNIRQTKSFEKAVKETARAKLTLSGNENEARNLPSNLRQLQENELFRSLLFLFGVLPQTIKLFACTGLFWSKIWAAMYLVSFVLLETLVLLPQSFFRNLNSGERDAGEPSPVFASRRTQNLIKLWQRWYPGIVMLCHIPVVYVLMLLFVHLGKVYSEREAFEFPGTPGIIVAGIIVVSILVLYELTPRFYSDETGVLIATTGLLWVSYSRMFMNLLQPTLDENILDALQIFVGETGAQMSMSGYGAMVLRVMSMGATQKQNTRAGVGSFVLYLVVVLAYFIAVYDTKGTFKPAWAEYLG